MFKRLIGRCVPKHQSYFLFGPRGTGKTQWVRTTYPTALYFDLLEGETLMRFQADPGRLEQEIPTGFKDWIIIDEVQKVPQLLNEVHRLIESKCYKFILTGSSARKLRQKGVNLLAGRALTYHMHPLTTIEMSNEFNLQKALQHGMLPGLTKTESIKKFLSSYVQTYLREEVLQEGLTRNLALFTRFLEVASFSQGEILNYTDIAREVATSRTNVTNYFDILDDLLIGSRLYNFTKRAKRALITHPKFYYFDVGVYRIIRPKGPLDSAAEEDGASLETLFLQQLSAINDYYNLNYKIHYWRTQSGAEVDFVIYGEHGLFAFEIKRKARIISKDLSGLSLFLSDYPEAKCFLLYGGQRRYFDNDIEVIPFEHALKNLLDLITLQKSNNA